MTPATRSSLILVAFAVSGFGLTTAWVYREAIRVKREREARNAASAPETGEMVWIKPGGFTMGSIDGADDEKPIHDVKVRGFFIDRTEVTNAEFARFVAATGHVPAGGWKSEKERDAFPAVNVTWADAGAYASWAGKRLPTEAEWEFAARGGVDRLRFPWGNELLRDGRWAMNIRDDADGFPDLAPVASFPPNSYGLFDTSGNAAEWCADWYLPDYYKATSGNKASRDNPPGPTRSYDSAEPGVWKRVVRGGSWQSEEVDARNSTRGKVGPDVASPTVGFRCVRDPR
ncbi:MAG: formylglycine-generating enzyme family protein [Chthoniobacteraceae bacterium]